VRVASLALALFAYWVLLSGHYTAFLLGAGALSAIVIAFAGRIFGYTDREGHPVELTLAGVRYWPWLVVEIAKSALAVSRIILTPSLPVAPQIVRLKAGPETAVGMATLAHARDDQHRHRPPPPLDRGPRPHRRRRGRPRGRGHGPPRHAL